MFWWFFQSFLMCLNKGNMGHPRGKSWRINKCEKSNALIQEYVLFILLKGETIVDVQKRFTHIVNHLIGLWWDLWEKGFKHQNPRMLVQIMAAKGHYHIRIKRLDNLNMLREHELEMNRLNEHKSEEKQV